LEYFPDSIRFLLLLTGPGSAFSGIEWRLLLLITEVYGLILRCCMVCHTQTDIALLCGLSHTDWWCAAVWSVTHRLIVRCCVVCHTQTDSALLYGLSHTDFYLKTYKLGYWAWLVVEKQQ
jgi:hypothetical protein